MQYGWRWFSFPIFALMFYQLFHYRLLFKRLLIVFLLFTLCRVMFYVFNYHYLPAVSVQNFLLLLIYGWRFDISAIIYINLLFILLHILPLRIRNSKGYQQILKFLFLTSNSIALLFETADFVYFRFTLKRTTADVFGIAGDFFQLLPQYLKDFWYLLFIWMGLVLLDWVLYRKTEKINKMPHLNYFYQGLFFILSPILFLVGMRGGLQLKPITPITASNHVEVALTPLVINTSFNILQTLEHSGLKEKKYFTDKELQNIFSAEHLPNDSTGDFKNENVIIIVMESFSKEYIGGLHQGKGFTPFLDSLMKESWVCTHAFANAKRSNEGLVAIAAGIPALMDDPLMISNYQNNTLEGLGNLLKKKNYTTSFFHGAKNGTMGFDYFFKSAGFDNYFGKTEYGNDNDYDGSWGIYDEPFFQFTAKKLNELHEPFAAVLFSLSSHHPYKIPKQYRVEFREKKEYYASIRYADYSLRKFFETASQMSWFENTLFVITADHTGESENAYQGTAIARYEIPILFYKKNNFAKGYENKITQQIDILPSVLTYLNYDKPYVSFGESVFDSSAKRFAYNYHNGIYQITDQNYLLQFDGEKTVGFFNYKTDGLLQTNLVNEKTETFYFMESYLRAIIQTYNHRLISNKLFIP